MKKILLIIAGLIGLAMCIPGCRDVIAMVMILLTGGKIQ